MSEVEPATVPTPRLAGKVAIVTGTSPNIGGVAASGFAAHGAKVACNDIDAAVAQDRADRITAAGGDAIAVPADVTDEDAVEAMVASVVERWGQVDVVLNNAVQFNAKGLLEMPFDQYQRQLDIILGGCFLVTRAAARTMIEQGRGGSIINVLSTAAWQGHAGNVGYCTGKSGLLNFTRSVAMELAPHGVRVVSLTPTATDPAESVERAARWGRPSGGKNPGNFMEKFRLGVPMQKLPAPSNYADAAVFLASERASMMTGSDLKIDAGAVSRYWAWNPSE